MPPIDLIEDVVFAWREAGLDPVECMRKCASVTTEFAYDEQEDSVRRRLRPKTVNSKTFPVRNRPLAEAGLYTNSVHRTQTNIQVEHPNEQSKRLA